VSVRSRRRRAVRRRGEGGRGDGPHGPGEGAGHGGGRGGEPELHGSGVRPLEERGPRRGERRGCQEGGPRRAGASRLGRGAGPGADGEQADHGGRGGVHREGLGDALQRLGRHDDAARQRHQPLRGDKGEHRVRRGRGLRARLHGHAPDAVGQVRHQHLRQGPGARRDREGGSRRGRVHASRVPVHQGVHRLRVDVHAHRLEGAVDRGQRGACGDPGAGARGGGAVP